MNDEKKEEPRTQEVRGRGRPKVTSDGAQSQAILAATRRLFLAHGYDGTTMDDIVAACHVSKRTLYRLFPGKPELFAAVVADHAYSMLALPDNYDHLPLAAAIAAIFRVDITEEEERERISLLQLFMIEASRSPELAPLTHRHGPERSRRLLADWLRAEQDKGRLRVGDTLAAAKILMDMLFGAVVLKPGNGPEWPVGDTRRAYQRQCIDIFVNGVAAERERRVDQR